MPRSAAACGAGSSRRSSARARRGGPRCLSPCAGRGAARGEVVALVDTCDRFDPASAAAAGLDLIAAAVDPRSRATPIARAEGDEPGAAGRRTSASSRSISRMCRSPALRAFPFTTWLRLARVDRRQPDRGAAGRRRARRAQPRRRHDRARRRRAPCRVDWAGATARDRRLRGRRSLAPAASTQPRAAAALKLRSMSIPSYDDLDAVDSATSCRVTCCPRCAAVLPRRGSDDHVRRCGSRAAAGGLPRCGTSGLRRPASIAARTHAPRELYAALHDPDRGDRSSAWSRSRRISRRGSSVIRAGRVVLDVSGLQRLFGEAAVDCRAPGTVPEPTAGRRSPPLRPTALLAGAEPASGVRVAVAGTARSRCASVPLARASAAGRRSRRAASIAHRGRCAVSTSLRRWGLTTLGELAALPAGRAVGAPRRRTASRCSGWRAVGSRPLVPDPGCAAASSSRFELEWPIDTLEPLSFVLARLLEPLSAALERADRGAAALRLRAAAHRSDHASRACCSCRRRCAIRGCCARCCCSISSRIRPPRPSTSSPSRSIRRRAAWSSTRCSSGRCRRRNAGDAHGPARRAGRRHPLRLAGAPRHPSAGWVRDAPVRAESSRGRPPPAERSAAVGRRCGRGTAQGRR